MLPQHTSIICTIIFCLFLASCATAPPRHASATLPVKLSPTATASLPSPTPTATHATAPKSYSVHILLRGIGRPDDLAFDQQGRLLFSDPHNGTVSRLNADGSVTVLLRGLAGPEGIVVLANGSMIIAEQNTNRILELAPGASSPAVLRALPGTPGAAPCKDGVDGIAYDATSNTLIIPDSPTGSVYRMSLDGKTLTLLATGIPRPVGAAVDAQGNIYIADECGGALWRITPSKTLTSTGGFGMLDDVAFDGYGDVLVTDLAPAIHALIRVNLAAGKRETLVSQGLIEPQGLAVDSHGDIFVSDDYANLIMELQPA